MQKVSNSIDCTAFNGEIDRYAVTIVSNEFLWIYIKYAFVQNKLGKTGKSYHIKWFPVSTQVNKRFSLICFY